MSENRFKEPKLPSSPELRRIDPKERRSLSSPSLERKMGASVEQSSGSRAIPKLQCWKPWKIDPGAPLLGMLESKSSAHELEGALVPEPVCELHFCCCIPNTFTSKGMV